MENKVSSMKKRVRSTRSKPPFAQRCVAVCTAVLLALSPMSSVAFADGDVTIGSGSAAASEDVRPSDAPDSEAGADAPNGAADGTERPADVDDAVAPSGESEADATALSPDAVAAAAAASPGSEKADGDADADADAVETLELSMKWLNVPDDQTQNLSWSDPVNLGNPTQIVTYRLSIASSNSGYAAGNLVVRVPQSLWNSRYGRAINPQSLGIPQAPNTGSTIPFNYSVDTAANELVIANTADVPAASNYEIDVQYSVIPWNTVDGSLAELSAQATGTTSSGTVNQATSNTITYAVDTDVRSDNVLKTDGRPMYYWDAAYTGGAPEPADFSDYRWVSWRIVMGGAANQPYTVTLNDVPGEGGQVYAVADGDLYYHDLMGKDFTVNSDGSITSKVFDDPTVRGPASAPIPANGEGNCIRVLVRYPKTGDDVLTNAVQETLKGVDSQQPHVSSSSATMDWKDYDFDFNGDPTSMVKFSGDYESQNKLENSQIDLLKRGIDVSLTWGMRTTENLYSGVNYNGRIYSGEMTDDVTYWTPQQDASMPAQATTPMTSDDLLYESARVYVDTYRVDRGNGNKIYYDQNTPDAPKITVWAMAAGTADFVEVDSFYASELSYENASSASYKEVTFPAGTVQAKVSYEDAEDYLYLRMDPTVKIKADSPTLRTWLDEAAAQGDDLTTLRVQNFNYYKVFGEDGTPLNPVPDAYAFDPSYVDNDALAQRDNAVFGGLLSRSSAGITMASFAGASETVKMASNPVNDTAGQAVGMEYWLHGRDWYDVTVDEYDELIAVGWPPPSRDQAVFYDLLPRGMVYDARQYPVVYDIKGRSNTTDVNVQTIDNFRGTERQMVVFTVESKVPGDNSTSSTEVWVPHKNDDGTVSLVVLGYQPPSAAGFTVKFHTIVPWNKVSFANQDTNLAAFQVPENDQLRGGGHADDGEAPIVEDVKGDDGRPVFADLRGDGINESVMDTKYMTLQSPINVPIALGSGLVKHVRSDDSAPMDPYTRTAATMPNHGYTYKMTTNTDSISRMKDLVLFDILEEAQNTDGATGETSWKGMLDSVDASDARIIGIEPRVYYSTVQNLSYNTLNVNDLNNPAVWTMTEPVDHGDITAVAVDLRYQPDGSEYVFAPSTGASVLLHMRAPSDLPAQEFAFNRAAYYSTLLDPTGGAKTELNVGDRTAVDISGTPTLTKASEPEGGTTSDDAATVQPGHEIVYTLTFDPMRVNARNIVVRDFVPADVDLVAGSITFTPAGSSTAQPVADEAYDAVAGQLVWPAYDQAVSGPATFQFKVTARPLEKGDGYRLYENRASATIDDESPIDSNVVTHQQLNRWADVAKTASLIEGVLPTDPDAAHGGTELGEDGGTEAMPVETGLSQIVEYHVVVKNVGANQTSGEIEVTDAVPAGAAYIPDSATVTFRSSADPSQTLPASTASAAIEQPVDAHGQVVWTLQSLSDGEEAYLTFRVSAPPTAFDADQEGMWASKTFENTAQMRDVAKSETETTGTTYHRVQEARIGATKQWDDAVNRDGIRPQGVFAQLYADGAAVGEALVLSDANGWSHNWTGLPATNPETGEHITYTVLEEPSVPGYENPVYSTSASGAPMVTILNRHVPGTPMFVKTSDPLGGTDADDAVSVQPGQEITYTLAFNPVRVNAKNIVVTDLVPEGLELVAGSITFTPAGSSTPQVIDDAAYNDTSRVLTWPSYDQEVSGIARFQFKATVTPLEKGAVYRLYENQATATMDGEPPIESNTITHQQLNRWADVAKTASLVEGVTPADADAAYGGTVTAEDGGTAARPVEAGLEQIVEYHMVIKNTGMKQTSGEIDVTDAIPEATTYIPDSATYSFRSSVDPDQPLPGSSASAIIQQPSADNPEVVWKLQGLSDGEEAYLTFRVSAPPTAFGEGQAGMWASKEFENVAQMVDVAKSETKTTETTHHRVQEARLTAVKQWNDVDDKDGIRPENIIVQLYADGEASGDPVVLDEGNGWTYTWRGLVVANASTGERVMYAVEETQAVDGYEAPAYAIDPNDASLTTIVNTHVPETPNPPEPPVPPKPGQPVGTATKTARVSSTAPLSSTGDTVPFALAGLAVVASVVALSAAGVHKARKKKRG